MFKDKLKELRKQKNLTQDELAKELYVTRSAVAKWEQGRGLPEEETLKRLCEYFQVSESELLSKEEPIKIINRMNKKRRNYIVTIISLILIFAVSDVSIVWYVNDKNNRYNVKKNQFYNQKTLSKYGLSNLKRVITDGTDTYLTVIDYDDNTYYCNVESVEVATQYAEYVFSYLQNSLDISFVGYEFAPMFEGLNKQIRKEYVRKSSNIKDYLTEYKDSSNESEFEHYYCFNYVTLKNSKHVEKEKMIFNCISITYTSPNFYIQSGLIINDKTIYFNFIISITTVGESYWDYYFFEDYYDLEKIAVNQDNFDDYFVICNTLFSKDDPKRKYNFWINQKSFYEHLTEYLNSNLDLVCEEYFLICDFSVLITTGTENKTTKEITFKQHEPSSFDIYFEEVDYMTNPTTGKTEVSYDVKVNPGFIYKLVKK